MRDVSFGQYYPSNSIVHKLDVRTKILMVILYIVTIFFVVSFIGFAIIALFVFFASILSKIPLRKLFKSIRPILYVLIFTFVITVLFYTNVKESSEYWQIGFKKIYKDSLIDGGKMAVRLILLVLGSSLLTFTSTPVELTDGMEFFLKPLKLLFIPVHELGIIMGMALRLIPTLMEETDKIVLAQKARCADFESKNLIKKVKSLLPVLIPLFVSAFRRADDLADAIDSRCYKGAKGRTKMKVMKIHFSDILALFVLLIFCFLIFVIKYNFFDLDFIKNIMQKY